MRLRLARFGEYIGVEYAENDGMSNFVLIYQSTFTFTALRRL